MGAKDKSSGKSQSMTTKPQQTGSSADSRGEATPRDPNTTKDQSENSSIVSPNVHLAITTALVAVLFGLILVSWSMSAWSGSGRTVIESPTLKRLESDCRKKNADVIQCITNMLEPKDTSPDPWLSEIHAVYGSSDDFRKSLRRLRDIYAYMKDKNIKFPDIKEQVDALHTQVSDLVKWKKVMDLQKEKPPAEKPETSSWNEKLGNFSTFKQETEQTFQNPDSQLIDIQNVKLPGMQNDININKKGIKDLKEDFERNKQKTGEALERHEASIKEIKSDLMIVKTDVSTLKKGMENLEIKVDNNKIKTDNQVQRLSSRVDQTDKVIDNIVNVRLPDIQKGVDDAMNKAGENQQALGDYKDLAEKRQAEYNKYRQEIKETQGNTQFKQSVSQELIDEMRNKMVLHDASFYMGLLSIGCCVLMFVNMIKNYKSSGQTSEFRTTADKQIRPRENKDIYPLKWHGPKENSVCVVTFHSETERQHIAETKSVFESVGHTLPNIHSRVIRRHSDIQDLPGSRIFLVFVDFNERNVILEDPAKGLGDLRVTTVRSLWKFGGDVTVIYCRDHGSKSLGGELFNRDLASIYSQTELSQLKNQQRMLSIFTEFSDAQKQHCREFINRQLNGN